MTIRAWPSLKCILIVFSAFFFSSTTFLCGYILSIDDCTCPKAVQTATIKRQVFRGNATQHKLAVLVPFRDRFEELLQFIPHMSQFLGRQHVNHHFFVLNQIDELRFNRASLINVGFKQLDSTFDYFVIHDVDLLPLRDELSYAYPKRGVFHVSSPGLHPKYNYQTFLGGILIIKREDFEKVNGMSNRYWGWGLEDDEFYTRLRDAQIEIIRPTNQKSNSSNTFLHSHDRVRRRRDTRKCFNQLAVTRRRDRVTGLRDVRFNITTSVPMQIESVAFTVINTVLHCDFSLTPWCQCDGPSKAKS